MSGYTTTNKTNKLTLFYSAELFTFTVKTFSITDGQCWNSTSSCPKSTLPWIRFTWNWCICQMYHLQVPPFFEYLPCAIHWPECSLFRSCSWHFSRGLVPTAQETLRPGRTWDNTTHPLSNPAHCPSPTDCSRPQQSCPHCLTPDPHPPVPGQPRLFTGLSSYTHHCTGLTCCTGTNLHRSHPLALWWAAAAAAPHHQAPQTTTLSEPQQRHLRAIHTVLHFFWHSHTLPTCIIIHQFTSSSPPSSSDDSAFLHAASQFSRCPNTVAAVLTQKNQSPVSACTDCCWCSDLGLTLVTCLE